MKKQESVSDILEPLLSTVLTRFMLSGYDKQDALEYIRELVEDEFDFELKKDGEWVTVDQLILTLLEGAENLFKNAVNKISISFDSERDEDDDEDWDDEEWEEGYENLATISSNEEEERGGAGFDSVLDMIRARRQGNGGMVS